MGLLGRGGPVPRWRARTLQADFLRLCAAHARAHAGGVVRENSILHQAATSIASRDDVFFWKNCPWAEKTATPCLCLLPAAQPLLATPAWPTPMRALISKFNSSHAPAERLIDSALFNRWARRASARIPTSPSNVAARSSCGGLQCGCATARHRANASGQHFRRGNGRARNPRAEST